MDIRHRRLQAGMRILLLLFLTACAPPDYVAWHPVDGAGLADDAQRHGMSRSVRGFTRLPKNGEPCHIWAAPNDYEAILHELRHCKEGYFHK